MPPDEVNLELQPGVSCPGLRERRGFMVNILFTAVGVALVALLWITLYDGNRFTVTGRRITDPRIKKPCRGVVLADLHNKCYGRKNERLLRAVRECRPDFVLVAGDMLTAKPGRKPDVALHLMGELARDFPVYYGNGNHEHRLKLYREKYGDLAERYEEGLGRLGIRRLVNSHISLGEFGICVYGSEIDRFYYKRFKVQHMEPGYLEGILGAPDENSYTVLIAHNPDYFPQYAAWGADLVLAGHVHGGMVRLPLLGKGVVSPNVRLFPKYDSGVFKEGKTTMFLSRGLGMHTIPVRVFNPGELTVIDFEGE